MKIINLLLIVFCLSITTDLQAQHSGSFHNPGGKNKLSVDLITGVWGRTPFTSEYGLVYHRDLNPKTEWSAKLAYSGHNIFLGGVVLNNSEGGLLSDSLGIIGAAAGIGIQYFLGAPGKKKWLVGFESQYNFTGYRDKGISNDRFQLSKLTGAFMLGYRLNVRSLRMEVDALVGLGIAIRNYSWQKQESRSVNENGEVINAAWRVNWGLNLEPSIGWAVPLSVRVGHRF